MGEFILVSVLGFLAFSAGEPVRKPSVTGNAEKEVTADTAKLQSISVLYEIK
ncbi:MAG: hypothetical protein LBV03_05140 [Fusobacteriales bacterium]|nr:hypothetical protein [Fusobacteriales bacterium]